MNITIIIPVFNEEKYLDRCIGSIIEQTLLPTKLLLVNDNSSDNSEAILKKYAKEFLWIEYINIKSNQAHIPGEKIIRTFYKGLEKIDSNYDIICKFDEIFSYTHLFFFFTYRFPPAIPTFGSLLNIFIIDSR